ncbi:MAG: ABC transporter permease [Candidatus Hydrogenedentota bacterium]
MNRVLRMTLRELMHRKIGALLAITAIALAIALYVGFNMLTEAANQETIRIMRDMGFNLRIIPEDAAETVLWTRGYVQETMPEDYAQRFADQEGISYNHLVATLHQPYTAHGHPLILSGIAPEVVPPGRRKRPMAPPVPPGTVTLGYHAARVLDVTTADDAGVELDGRRFAVNKILAEAGGMDDVRIYAHLDDVQALVDMPGRINEIMALECLCAERGLDNLAMLREQLAGILPEAKVIRMSEAAEVREKQRFMIEDYLALVMPLALVASVLWIGLLAMINVRERRTEIGILRALGYDSRYIAGLFLAKACLLGLAGAVVGSAIGAVIALVLGPAVFQMTAHLIRPDLMTIAGMLLAAPLFAALASLIPAMLAVTQDPADVLREA